MLGLLGWLFWCVGGFSVCGFVGFGCGKRVRRLLLIACFGVMIARLVRRLVWWLDCLV